MCVLRWTCETLCGVGEMGEGGDGVKFMVWPVPSAAQQDADVTSMPHLFLLSSVLHKELKAGMFCVFFFHFRGSDCQNFFIFAWL